MKRALIVLLLLAVAGGLFAQVTFSGSVQSGVEVVIPSEGDTTFHWFSRDAGIPYRFHLGASYTNEAGTAGASGNFRNNNGGIGFDGANAWVEPIDDVLRLQAGTGGPGGFGSLGSFGEGNGAADKNFNIKLTPVLSGSTFAAGLGIGPGGAGFDKAAYGVGLTFGLTDLLNAAANLEYIGADERTDVAAGVGVLALNAASGESGLTRLAVDVVANNITDLEWIGIGPAVGFRVANVLAGNLTATLQSRIYVPMKDNDLDYWVGLDVSVPFTSLVGFNLNAGFEGNGVIPAVAESGTLSVANGEGTGRAIGGSGDPSFVVRPRVTFNIGGSSTLELAWSLQALLASEVKIQNAIAAMVNVGF